MFPEYTLKVLAPYFLKSLPAYYALMILTIILIKTLFFVIYWCFKECLHERVINLCAVFRSRYLL